MAITNTVAAALESAAAVNDGTDDYSILQVIVESDGTSRCLCYKTSDGTVVAFAAADLTAGAM